MNLRVSHVILCTILSMVLGVSSIYAEGNEGLFEAQIAVQSGSGFVAAGTGLDIEPGLLNIDVPAGSTITQVLMYWNGSELAPVSAGNSLELDGTTVMGRPVSDPLYFFTCNDCGAGLDGDHYYTTYRADITDLGLVAAGNNSFSVTSSIGGFATGAGMIVIYDDGSPVHQVQVIDGTDFAFQGFGGARQVTLPREFRFDSSVSERSGTLTAFVGNVNSPANTIRITIGSDVTEIEGALDSGDGALWDTFSTNVVVPAGVDEVTVEMIDGGGSLIWVNAALQLENASRPEGRREFLGISSLATASGTGVIAAGIGLDSSPSDALEIDVPGSVVQAILYWSGAMLGDVDGDDTMLVNGTTVTGTQVGLPTFAFPCTPCGPFTGDFYFSSYRADITGLGLVGSGSNTLELEMDFFAQNSGASLLVIYDDGSSAVDVHLRDGIDVAIGGFPTVRGDTVRQYFDFDGSDASRDARIDLFVGSANDGLDTIEVTVDGNTTSYDNLLSGADGAIWDTVSLPVTVPAGVEYLSVRIMTPSGPPPQIDDIIWVGAALSLETADAPPVDGDGSIEVRPGSTFLGGYAEVVVTPTDGDGQLLGAGLDVDVSSANVQIGGVVDNGDGTYTQLLGATALGTDTITATVNGDAISESATLEVEVPPSSIFGVRDDGTVFIYGTIQEALYKSAADSVETVYVSPGTYAERVWAWNLSGLTIEALSAESTVQMRGFRVVCCHDIAIRGFDVYSQYYWDGFRFYGGWASSHQVLIDRCVVDDMGDGITLRSGNSDIVVRDCELTGNVYSGVFAWGSGPYFVQGTDMSDNGLSGIDAGYRGTEITLIENTIEDNGWICPNCGWGVYRYTFGSGGANLMTFIDNEFSGNLGSVSPGQSDENVYRYDLWIDETDQQAPYTP